ncbi:hypothetical protein FFF34_007135 [Inquilinus sp. KBS0705]|nr:hypothetical protein FFF34_007135 [Inquilinus sp. KBS0705]
MAELKLYKSRWKAIKLLFLASPFIAFGLYEILYEHGGTNPIMAWLAVCFFGLAIPISLFMLLDQRPEIIIDERGLFSRSSYGLFEKKPNRGFVEWQEIKDTYIVKQPVGWRFTTGTHKYICIKLTETAKKTNNKYSKQNAVSKFYNLGDFCIPLLTLNVNENNLNDFIKAMLASDLSKKINLIQNTKL